jgi:hypothetical protein
MNFSLITIFSVILMMTQHVTIVAQEITFKGKLFDKENGEPVVYANIYSASKGVYSNADGFFELQFFKNNKADTITISCIGFSPVTLKADTLISDFTYQIGLASNITQLKEITISGKLIKLSPEQIVTNAIEQLNKSSYNNEFVFEAFYRQSNLVTDNISTDIEFLRYIEAAIYLRSRSRENYGYTIREVRRSDDKRFQFLKGNEDIKTKKINEEEQRFDLSENFLKIDYKINSFDKKSEFANTYSLLNPSIGNLNNNFIDRHTFKMEKITSYGDESVYVIKVLPSKKSTGIESGKLKGYYLPIGRLYISVDDFGILEFQYNYIRNPNKNDRVTNGLVKLMNQGEFIFKDVIKYRRYNGNLFLSYMMREQSDTVFVGGYNYVGIAKKTNTTSPSGYFKVRRELFVTNIITNKSMIENLDFSKKYLNPFPKKYQYNQLFWESFNKILPSNIEYQKLKDLGNGRSIEEQFIENARGKN